MKKWTVIMLLIAVALFGTVIGFNFFKQHKIEEFLANRPEPEYPVTVIETAAEDWIPNIEAIGFIEPHQGVTLTSEVSGVIDKIGFESGATIKEGQFLVSLDSDVERANLKSAQARLPAARATYKRSSNLLKRGSISKAEYDNSAAEYFSLQADIESLKATISRREIRAPFSGIVGIRDVHLGEYLEPGNRIARLEDTSIMRLRFTVPQTDISRIHVDQVVHILVDSYPNEIFEGTITAIEPAINYQSGLIQIQASIPNTQDKLRSGMFTRAQVVLPTMTEQVILPQTAITYTLYGDSVYVLDTETKRVTQRQVKLGERKKDKVLVLSGLKAGETVVTSGQVRLSNDAKVKVVTSDATTPPAETPML